MWELSHSLTLLGVFTERILEQVSEDNRGHPFLHPIMIQIVLHSCYNNKDSNKEKLHLCKLTGPTAK